MKPFAKKRRQARAVVLEGQALTVYISNRRQALADFTPERPFSPLDAAVLLGATRTNPFAKYPIRMDMKDHELIHHVWSSGQVSFQPFRDYWFSLGLLDTAAMHMVLSNAAIHLNALRGNQSEYITILTHNAAAIESVNVRIRDKKLNTSDDLMGAILGLMCHDHLIFQYERCALHMAGFQKILMMRGGLSSIQSNQYVRLSLYWIEYNISVDQDIIPLHPPPFHLFKAPYSTLPRSAGLLHSDKAMKLCGISSLVSLEMSDILSDLSLITVALKKECSERIVWNDSNWVGFGIYPTIFKLLSIQARSEEDELKSLIQGVCRLSGILFLSEIRRKFGVAPIVTEVQAIKLQRIFATNKLIWHEDLEALRLWALVITGCAISTKIARAWVMEEMAVSHFSLRYRRWDDIIKMVSQLWWIDDVFLSKCMELEIEYIEALNAP